MNIMYAFLGLLLILLWYSLREKESFTVHIEGGMDILTPVKETVQSVTTGMRDTITRPMYNSLMGIVPYKHHYRKLRRYLYSK